MAEKAGDAPIDAPSQQTLSLEKGDNPIPSLVIGEMGQTGLLVLGGNVLEECSAELRWPECIETYKKMCKDATISPAVELVEMMISRTPWEVKVPEGSEERLKEKAKFLQQCMNDMEHPWSDFIKQAATFNRYGFSPHEKVFRYRRKSRGSKYDDGLVGIRKLPIRSQDSVAGWQYSANGRNLTGLYQKVIIPQGYKQENLDFVRSDSVTNTHPNSASDTGVKFIPRNKFILFRNNPLKDNPEGQSPLIGAWQAWKYKQAFAESEALATAQEANGFKVLYLPAQYMSDEASAEDKEVYETYKKMMANAHQAKQSGFILPLIRDESGNKMFEFDIKSVVGNRGTDIDKVIRRYSSEILTALFSDMLTLGNEGGGSFSLSESKMSIVEMGIQAKLDEIKSQLNHDLVPQLFALNGWDLDELPYFDYGVVSKESLDELSKYFQRCAATGLIPKVPEVINHILSKGGFTYRVKEGTTQEELNKILSPDTSRSGDGMSTAGDGTSNSVSEEDNSVSNNEN